MNDLSDPSGLHVRARQMAFDGLSDVRSPEDIVGEALRVHRPAACFVGFSGGGDSIVATHWAMTHIPGCRPLHINTGIGIERARQHVRETCRRFGWDLLEVRAKEDCGQDYDEIVKKFGFPGPFSHRMMYVRLKERCVQKVVRDFKTKRSDRVLIATGIYKSESRRRSGYGALAVNRIGAQVWVNPLYWWEQEDFAAYRKKFDLPENPVSKVLGMSGECLCGAFAHKGEKALVRIVCPETADRLDRLEREVRERGFPWGWEGKPPKGGHVAEVPGFLCTGCGKHDQDFGDDA